jgi:methionine biosynthesis protein MetW
VAIDYGALVKQKGLGSSHLYAAELIASNSEVLDIGCASGYLAEILAQKGCRVTGVELDPKAAAQARKTCPKVIEGSIENKAILDALQEKYDYILLLDVLEHLVDPEAALVNLKSKLKPKGQLIVSLPNVAYYAHRLSIFLLGKFEYQESGIFDRTHLHFYTLNSAQKTFKAAGYRLKDILVNASGLIQPDERKRLKGNTISRLAKFLCMHFFPNLFVMHATYVLI